MMSLREIRIDDAQAYLDRVIARLRVQRGSDEDLIVAVLNHIVQYIEVTKREIGSLRAGDQEQNFFSTASEELQEVVTEAAKATNEIMSAAEEIERLDRAANGGARAVEAAVTRIYVACAFQDITGQRIAKVIRALGEIESRVAALATACGGEVESRTADAAESSADAALLNGPQRADQAQSQSDIDKLFESAN
jgi:chemotaxis protein CheZ